MKKKGISLIVLIITIVVIIILATAIIVNIAQTNLIENSNEAVVKQDFKTMQDELTMYKADKYVESRGNFKAEDLDITNKKQIAEIIPSIVGTKYEEYVVIEDGRIAISEDMPEKERKWAKEALGLIKTSTNRPTEPEIPTEPETPDEPKEPVTPIVLVNTKVETANSSITGGDFLSTNPVIPVGFKAINTTDANWNDANNDGIVDGWNNGLVIQDEDLNEFVWVPCTTNGANGTIQYTKNFNYPSNYGATSENTSDDIEALPMKDETTRVAEVEQITKYGGFYIGRYEAGVPGKTGTPSNSKGKPTVQQGATVWININYANSNASAKSFINTDKVKSGLVTGTQWDTAMKWIENAGISVTDSTSWGNYKDDPVDGDNGKHTAGFKEEWKVKNIYDLAGNTWEWTGENYSTYRSYRGGSYNGVGSTYPASCRRDYNPSLTSNLLSFRLSLYVM